MWSQVVNAVRLLQTLEIRVGEHKDPVWNEHSGRRSALAKILIIKKPRNLAANIGDSFFIDDIVSLISMNLRFDDAVSSPPIRLRASASFNAGAQNATLYSRD